MGVSLGVVKRAKTGPAAEHASNRQAAERHANRCGRFRSPPETVAAPLKNARHVTAASEYSVRNHQKMQNSKSVSEPLKLLSSNFLCDPSLTFSDYPATFIENGEETSEIH